MGEQNRWGPGDWKVWIIDGVQIDDPGETYCTSRGGKTEATEHSIGEGKTRGFGK